MQKSPRAFHLRQHLKRPLAVASGGLTLGSRARFRPALCYVRREVETAREATCPKVRDMENEVRRARRTSAPFGWKASGLQALPAGLFPYTTLFRSSFFASSEPRVCLLRRAAAESRQNASECKCVPRGRAAQSGDISLCTRRLVCGGQGGGAARQEALLQKAQ